MYVVLRAIFGLNDTILLLFMVADHTKNVECGAFGYFKRKLKWDDAKTSSEMTHTVATYSDSVGVVV